MTQDIIEQPPECLEKIYNLPTPETETIYSDIGINRKEFEKALGSYLNNQEDLQSSSSVAIVIFEDIYQSNFTMSLYELSKSAGIPRRVDQFSEQTAYKEISDFSDAEFLDELRTKLKQIMNSEDGDLYVDDLIWYEHLEEQLMVCLLRALRQRFSHLGCWVGAYGETAEEWINRREWLPENLQHSPKIIQKTCWSRFTQYCWRMLSGKDSNFGN